MTRSVFFRRDDSFPATLDEKNSWSCNFLQRLCDVSELLGWISRRLCSGGSTRRPWGTSGFWSSQSSFISLPWCFCFPLSPPGNNGVHGSVESANTPSITTLCCTMLFALKWHVMPWCYYGARIHWQPLQPITALMPWYMHCYCA